jgi:hypothetical protein
MLLINGSNYFPWQIRQNYQELLFNPHLFFLEIIKKTSCILFSNYVF